MMRLDRSLSSSATRRLRWRNGIACFLAGALYFIGTGMGRAETAGNFFRLRQIDGVWWFIDPDGKPFISKGVTTVSFSQDHIYGSEAMPLRTTNLARYGTEAVWRKAMAARLLSWNFNTLGAWSDEKIADAAGKDKRLAYAVNIDFSAKFVARQNPPADAWREGIFPDVFGEEFSKFCVETAERECASRKEDPNLLGWFTDNELRWGPDWRSKDELLPAFLNLRRDQPGRRAAVELLQKRYGEDFGAFNAVWQTSAKSWSELGSIETITTPETGGPAPGQNQEVNRAAGGGGARAAYLADCDAFLAALAERYFSATKRAILAADPHHLDFGCRFAYVPAMPVVKAAAAVVDAISFNCYDADPRRAIDRYSVFGKPLLIGEFSFRGMDSGLPNTKGAGPIVPSQADRAAGFEKYVRLALSKPNLVGYHWFEHADEPKEGRFDGENSNYGTVDIHDDPYRELTDRMTEINGAAEALHREAK